MIIRPAQEKDFHEIYALICELENEQLPYEDARHTYLTNLSDKNIYYYVAEDGGTIAAFGSMHIQNLLHHCGKAAELQEMIVSKKDTGKGTGSQLIENFHHIAIENQCRVFEVCCNKKRKDAHRFYRRHGLTPTHYKFTLPIS